MRTLLSIVFVFCSSIFISAQRDTLVSGIKLHLVSDADTGTAWIQQKFNKKGQEHFRGWYVEYYRDGKLKAKGHYKNGKRSDDWTRYYPGGQIAEKGYFDGGYKSDLWQTFYENGKMSWKGSFFKNIPSGFWRYYYEDGKLKGMTRYRIHTEKTHTKKTGKTKGMSVKVNVEFTYSVSPADSLVEYYPDGKLRTRIIYGKEGGMTGHYKLYYENGKPNVEGDMYFGNKVGTWLWYLPDGSVWAQKEYTLDSPSKEEPQSLDLNPQYEHLSPWLKWEPEKITL
jgi:antitoxin component YwqK of YwqJK toxin-antitoxin module